MSSLYGLFGEVSYSCTLPFSTLKKCKKKSMASSWYLAANHFSYTFPPRLSFCNFFTYWHSLFWSLHLYSCANSNQLWLVSEKLICGRQFPPFDLVQNLKESIHLSYSEAEPKFVVLKVQKDTVFKLVTTTFLLATIFHHFGI